jgi:hypothetical protein
MDAVRLVEPETPVRETQGSERERATDCRDENGADDEIGPGDATPAARMPSISGQLSVWGLSPLVAASRSHPFPSDGTALNGLDSCHNDARALATDAPRMIHAKPDSDLAFSPAGSAPLVDEGMGGS